VSCRLCHGRVEKSTNEQTESEEREERLIHRTRPNKVGQSTRRFAEANGEKNAPYNSESRRVPHGELFAAGSVVRESGIYEVLHDLGHRSAHEVVMIAEELFPTCDVCDDRVRYRVLRTAPYIFSDVDFEDPKD
jgi:hypothetical protein